MTTNCPKCGAEVEQLLSLAGSPILLSPPSEARKVATFVVREGFALVTDKPRPGEKTYAPHAALCGGKW